MLRGLNRVSYLWRKARAKDRPLWLLAFAVFLALVIAAPVAVGAQSESPEPQVEDVPAPTPAEIAPLEEEQREQERWLASPEAIREREDSQLSFVDLSAQEAKNLLLESFSKPLEALDADPGRVLTGLEVEKRLGTNAAIVGDGEGGELSLLETSVPVKSDLGGDGLQPVDLTLERSDDGFVPVNPSAELALPASSDGAIRLHEGITLRLPTSTRQDAEPFGEQDLFIPETEPSTDTLLAPIAGGVEIFEQIRSVESSDEFTFELGLPEGATLESAAHGLAEVVAADGSVIEKIPPSSAVDAQGASVPVVTRVSGDELVVKVAHGGETSFAYPILLDPEFLEERTDFGAWVESPGGGFGLRKFASSLNAYSQSNQYYAPNTNAQWVYQAPGQTGYIAAATFSSIYYLPGSCKEEQPHGYIGLWDGNSGFYPSLYTYHSANGQNLENWVFQTGWTGYPGVRAATIGIGTAAQGANIGCYHELYVGGYSIQEKDPEAPSWTTRPSIADQWVDNSPIPISEGAYDPGLGVKEFGLWTTNSSGQNVSQIGGSVHPCSGVRSNPCPSSWSSQITNYSPASLSTGIQTLNVVAYDALGSIHNSEAGPVFLMVDHLAPQITYSGELLTEHPVKYHLDVTATDGSASSRATAQSGVKSLWVYLDGVLEKRWPDTATPPICYEPQQGYNVASCEFKGYKVDLPRALSGKHTLKLVATDSLNHSSVKELTLNLPPDTENPTVGITGPLRTAASGWLSGATSSVTVNAQDSETGVVESAVYVDETKVASSEQECFYGGCSLNKTYSVPLAGYSQGVHKIKAVAKDGAGNIIGESWSVRVDQNVPQLGTVAAPSVPQGWTPQIESFNLNYAATDDGSGIKTVEVIRPGPGGTTLKSTPYSSACDGSAGAPCEASVAGTASLSTVDMAEGSDTVTVKAYDAVGKVSGVKTVTVKVDRGAPSMTRSSGPLLTGAKATHLGVVSKLVLDVKDPGGGVGELELRLDGETVERRTLAEVQADGGVQTCQGEYCQLRYTMAPIVGEMATAGVHTATLVITDQAGHQTTVSHEFTLDPGPPAVSLSGSIAEAAGETLPGQTGSLTVKASDQASPSGSGISEIRISVDGESVVDQVNPQPTGGNVQHLWVLDQENNRVQEFTLEGEFVRAFGTKGSLPGQLSSPRDLTLDAQGDIWVADTANDRIEEFSQSGDLLSIFGSTGTTPGALSRPEGLAFDAAGNLWVSDSNNARMERFSPKGVFQTSFGVKGTATGQLGRPSGVKVDAAGNVVVSDTSNNRVSVFSATGTFIRQIGRQGSAPGSLQNPMGVGLDAKGNVWVADRANARIEGFKSNGEYLEQFGTNGTGEGQFLLPNSVTNTPGTFWVTDFSNGRIQKWASTTYVPTQPPAFVSTQGGPGAGNGQFSHPADVVIENNSAGTVLVVDQGNNRLQRFKADGTYIASYGATELKAPTGAAVDASGNIWVTNATTGKILGFSSSGAPLNSTMPIAQSTYYKLSGIAIDKNGNFWFTDETMNYLFKADSTGTLKGAYGGSGTAQGQLGKPSAVAAAPDGTIWVADWGNNRVNVYDQEGKFVRQVGSIGTTAGLFTHPVGIDIDVKGNAWVTDETGRVQAFDQTGKYLTVAGTKGTGTGQFNFTSPSGLAVSPSGLAWIADGGNNRLQKFQVANFAPKFVTAWGGVGTQEGAFKYPSAIGVGRVNHCENTSCPAESTATFTYDEAKWGTGPHVISVTATDGAGNTDTEEIHVNEPLNVVAPSCPTATPQSLPAGTVVGSAGAISGLEQALPSAVEPSQPIAEEVESEVAGEGTAISPAVTRNAEGVSLDEQGIDVVKSTMGGGVTDEAAGAFTVGQATCLKPLQKGAAASEPAVTEGNAVVFPNALPDTDTVVRPTAFGTTIIERIRGSQAPQEFKWATKLEGAEELVELPSGGLAIVDPTGLDLSDPAYPSEPVNGWDPNGLNDVAEQVAQAEREIALASNEIHGEVLAVLAPPEVIMEKGEPVIAKLRFTAGQVIVAQLPAGTFAEAEALVIKANPAFQPEDMCASILAATPQYYSIVCTKGLAPEPGGQPDSSENLMFSSVTQQMGGQERSFMEGAEQRFALAFGLPLPTEVYEVGEALNDDEKKICSKNPIGCGMVIKAGKKAAEVEDKVFNGPPGSQNTKGNAFRHAAWTDFAEEANHRNKYGLEFTEAHEGKEYANKAHPYRRRESQMDMMSDWVGAYDAVLHPEPTAGQLSLCQNILGKIPDAIFIGREAYPFRWAYNNHWGLIRPIFREWSDWRRTVEGQPNPTYGVVIVRNGRTCQEVW
jgi:tripartite motif-containing protein 71